MEGLALLPKVDTLSRSPALAGFSEPIRTKAARAAIAALRARALRGEPFDPAEADAMAQQEAARLDSPSIRRVINLSGVVLHTGLGRARLAPSVAAHVRDVAASHADVELDLESGRRGDRQTHVRGLLQDLTGAEDALVVNNCAAGVFLTLNALCSGGEVILSRGEMVEIGGSFRMPDIVRRSGCRLVEVGCTNKTRLADYEEAIGEQSVAILRCHPSNFRIVGFTETPRTADLAKLAHARRLFAIDDLGSGCLVDTTAFGLPKETTLQEAVAAGPDVVLASGDKLLGGPQAGLILGKREVIADIKRHPLARAVRVDKLTLAGLEATLRLYVQGRQMEIPTLRYLGRPLEEVKRLAKRLARAYAGPAEVGRGITEVGGGSAPGVGVPTWRVGLFAERADDLAAAQRTGEPAILGRIEDGKVWLDPRTLDADEVGLVEKRLRELGS